MRKVLVAALGVLALACQRDPHAHRLTTVKPEPRDVAGRYLLKTALQSSLEVEKIKALGCSLVLAPDGSFQARNVPPLGYGPDLGPASERVVSGSGTWRIDVVGHVDGKEVWGIHLDSK